MMEIGNIKVEKEEQYGLETDINVEDVKIRVDDTIFKEKISSSTHEISQVSEVRKTTETFNKDSQLIKFEITEIEEENVKSHEIVPQQGPSSNKINCLYCEKVFYDRRYLTLHKKYMHRGFPNEYEGGPIQCQICQEVFEAMEPLGKHILEYHPVRNKKLRLKFECAHCGSRWSSLLRLRKHMVLHMTESPFNCNICSKTFKTKSCLKDHISFVHSSEHFQCLVCCRIFQYHSQLRQHSVIHAPKRFKCPKCEKSFKTKYRLQYHDKSAHSTEKTLKCAICPETFRHKAELKCHTTVHHTDEKPFECLLCQSENKEESEKISFKQVCFKTESDLRSHIDHYHSKKNITCYICSKTFALKQTLKEHMKVHFDEGQFECKVCQKSFPHERSLKYHMKVHESYNYKCEICNKIFMWSFHFKLHSESHRPESNFKCQYCQKSFKGELTLREHCNDYHSGDRACLICGKIVSGRRALTSHMRCHKEPSLKCHLCCISKGYKEKINLTRHMMAVHKMTKEAANESFKRYRGRGLHVDKEMTSSNTFHEIAKEPKETLESFIVKTEFEVN